MLLQFARKVLRGALTRDIAVAVEAEEEEVVELVAGEELE